ncbi:GerAB/ArcD/ProY family transporter [Thalassobacillus hwangdonensis]|uniref:GerAB/ArcD/ProY family transporter n=1 Tax=Thalassobacillus hwangdonensis TaxID=546108 RepID=A0ABW3KUS7_9BACI
MENLQTAKISRRQFFFLILQTQLGVGILSLPYDLYGTAKQDGWISLLLSGVIILLILFLFWRLARKFPDHHFFQYMEILLGKWLSKFFILLYCFYFIAVGVLITLLFTRTINLWVLSKTPMLVVALLLALSGLYMANSSLQVIARMYVMLSFLIVVLIVPLLLVIQDLKLIYILPIGISGISPILKGMNEGIISFLGFIISLIVFPVVNGTDKQKLWTMLLAQLSVMGLYLFTILTSYTFFSSEEIGLVPNPLLYMLKTFEFQIVARLDIFFVSLWIIFVFTTFAMYVYMSGVGFSTIFKSKKNGMFNTISMVIILTLFILIGKNEYDIGRFSTYVTTSAYAFSIGVPVLILMLSNIRRRNKGRGSS